ncbi:MAG: hypothetical protein ACRDL3_07540 [Solirubrobacterales bacterium]
MRPPIRYAYLVSTSYSGTTLLSILLDGHPAIVSIGEVDNTIRDAIEAGRHTEYPCSCGAPIRECSFFTGVKRHCAQQGVELDLHDFGIRLGGGMGPNARRLLFGWPTHLVWLARARSAFLNQLPRYRRHVDHVFDRNIAIARAALDVSGKGVFLDASKGVARVPYLHRRSELDLRVIHIVRDVRAFAHSHRRRDHTRTARAARSWVRTHTNAIRLASLVGEDRYLRFRWEDFCVHPDESLDRIGHFLGAEPTELIARVNDQRHHVIGNRMRLKPVGSIRSEEGWREDMTPQQLAACERVAGQMNRLFGYR